MLKITSISDSPDIFFLTFAQRESSVCFSGVDDAGLKRLCGPGVSVGLDYSRIGNQVVQIVTGKSNEGFTFALLEKDQKNGVYFIST